MGVPELKPKDSAIETSQLCEKKSSKLWVLMRRYWISILLMEWQQEILIAIRQNLSFANSCDALHENKWWLKKREMRKIDPVSVGLPQETSLQNAAIFGHLTPTLQQLFAQKKSEDNNFRFCWTKNYCNISTKI